MPMLTGPDSNVRGLRAIVGLCLLLALGGCAPSIPSGAPASLPAGATSRPSGVAAGSPSAVSQSPTGSGRPPVGPAPSGSTDAPIAFVRHGSRATRQVALTFDDGWGPQRCLSIGKTLVGEGVPATFFINGKYLRAAPGVFRWLSDEGFPFGNHTFSHNDQTRLSPSVVAADIDNARRTLEAITGRPSIRVFRPPFGSSSVGVLAGASMAGYPVELTWDVDSRDWSGITVAQVIKNATVGVNGSVVLMHCGPSATPLALPAIIASYRARGFTFVTVPQLLGLASTSGPLWSPPAPVPPATPAPEPWPEVALPLPTPAWRPSLAIDPAGGLHVAYESPAGLMYGSNSGGRWSSSLVVPSTSVDIPTAPALAIDATGVVDIGYVDISPSAARLGFVSNRSGGWLNQSVLVLSPNPGTIGIAVQPAGAVDLAWRATQGASPGVRLTSNAGGAWQTTAVGGETSANEPSVAVDPAGPLDVAWRTDAGLTRFATNASGHWITITVGRGHWGGQLALDPAANVHLELADMADPRLRELSRAPNGSWSWATIANDADGTSLAFGPDGLGRVALWRLDSETGQSTIYLATQPAIPR